MTLDSTAVPAGIGGLALRGVLAFTLVSGGVPAVAATGGATLRATSATNLSAGSSVDFAIDVSWTLDASEWNVDGDPPVAPPFYGDVYRRLPGLGGYRETWQGDALWVQASNVATGDTTPVMVASGAVGPVGTWTFSMVFAQSGSFTVSANGSWNIGVEVYEDQFSVIEHWWGMGYDLEGPYGQRMVSQSVTSGNYALPSLTVTVVPEPASALLMAVGLLLGNHRRRRCLI